MRLARTIKNPETYISNIKDTDKFSVDNIVVEHRKNNPKRDYLFVNKKQCKHIPCNPDDMINMCKELAYKVSYALNPNLNVLVVAFAETATAIGNVVADNLMQCKYVMQTTREKVENSRELLTFEEEHSHATTQKLLTYSDERAVDLSEFNYILFVEDEISTGNTILNFIKAFEKIQPDMKFGVASVCNWQDEENKEKFIEKDIDTFALITGTLKDKDAKMLETIYEQCLVDENAFVKIKTHQNHEENVWISKQATNELFIEERLGHIPNRDLTGLLKRLEEDLIGNVQSVRVIGTEEFMYIPIKVAEYLENKGIETLCHSTTRSTIDVIADESTGTADSIKHRYEIKSVYDKERQTQIYNLEERTDTILFITDVELDKETRESIYNTFNDYADQTIILTVNNLQEDK